jgi:transcriptional regulator with XRE-family HTH domain
MTIGIHIRQWRLKRRLSMAEVEKKAGMAPGQLDLLEAGEMDPPVSMLVAVAEAVGIPVSWLYVDPGQVASLLSDDPDEEADLSHAADPVTEQVLRAKRRQRELFSLLAALVEHGDPRLLRAAETNLRSLVKETRRSPIPWANRQPGNLMPPSD